MRATTMLGAATALAAGLLGSAAAWAHGEKAQEPFIRMRTIQWYDTIWEKSDDNPVAINEQWKMRGKFRVMPESIWPRAAHKPDVAFLNISIPGPVYTREGSWINGVNMANSTTFLLGRDYAYEVELRARFPGHWHVHSMVNIQGAGPVVGPGKFVTNVGNRDDFTNPQVTLTGETIDLDSYGFANNVFVHVVWAVLALAWLGYWLMKPLFFSRYRLVAEGREDELITGTDRLFSIVMLVLAIAACAWLYFRAESKWPVTLPLQSAQEFVEPLPVDQSPVDVKLVKANYRVPGRSMTMTIEVTNHGSLPVRLGEFTTATVRFLNPGVAPMDEYTRGYPDDLLAENGLTVSDNTPIGPGETRTLTVTAQDAAWEIERLSTLIYDPDSRFGGLLFFYDTSGERHIANVGGVVVPIFTAT